MFEKYRRRFDKRRLVLIAAMALVALYVGWRTGAFETQPKKEPCVEGRREVKDDKGAVVQVVRTTCFEQKE